MAKTFNHLFETIVSHENLLKAARKAQKGKREKPYVDRFALNLEREIWCLQDKLASETYRPSGYHAFWIQEPKARLISAAPFRDRVVHHALCNVIDPLWERRFVDANCANRSGRGASAARNICERGLFAHHYVLHIDIRKYFPSLDHQVLKKQFRDVVRCRPTLRLMDTIVDGSNAQEPAFFYFAHDELTTPYDRAKGLPIGNLTSQLFANVYLDALDHFIKEQLRCRVYVRYVDDLLLFADDKLALHGWREQIEQQLEALRLKPHSGKTRIYRCADGLTFLGVRFTRHGRRLPREHVVRARRRYRKKLADYRLGLEDQASISRSWAGWRGHAAEAGASAVVRSLVVEARDWMGA